MNERDRIDRMLTAWTDETWSPPPPAYLGEVLARTRRTRQRPAWASLERWLPMELTLRRPALTMPLRLLAVVLALLLLLIAAMSVPFLFGSRGMPAMVATGWRNGLIAWAKDGDIWVVDPAVGQPRILIGGSEMDDGPDWSPDGTHVAFWRGPGAIQGLMTAKADGTDVTQVAGSIVSPTMFVWSPDGSELAVASRVNGQPAISIVSAAGGELRTLDLPFNADWAYWRPDGHSLLVRGSSSNGTGLYVVSMPDGAVGDPIALSDTTSAFYAGDRGMSDFTEPKYSTDGSKIVYVQGRAPSGSSPGVFGGPDTRNHVMNADGSDVRLVEAASAADYEDNGWFSPDDTRLLLVSRTGWSHQVGIITLDGSRPPVLTAPVSDPGGMPAIWSPDGTVILASRLTDGVSSLIDPETGEWTTAPWLIDNWADWQPLAPA